MSIEYSKSKVKNELEKVNNSISRFIDDAYCDGYTDGMNKGFAWNKFDVKSDDNCIPMGTDMKLVTIYSSSYDYSREEYDEITYVTVGHYYHGWFVDGEVITLDSWDNSDNTGRKVLAWAELPKAYKGTNE